jgi:translocation and assembly module TamA
VSIEADPNRRHRVQYGIGYGTDTQVRGTIAWEDRRVNMAGHRFRTEVKAASLSQSLDARYIVPIGDPATEKFTLQLTGTHERRADTDDQNINFTPSITQVRRSWFGENFWQRVLYVELLDTRTEFIKSNRVEEQTLLIPGVSFALVPRNYLGEALFSRTLFLELRGSPSSLGSDASYIQGRVSGEKVFDLDANGRWHIYMRGDIGATSHRRSASSRAAIAACAASASTTCHRSSKPLIPTPVPRWRTRTATRCWKKSVANTWWRRRSN